LNQSLTLIYHKNGYTYPVVHIFGLWIFSRKSYPPVDNSLGKKMIKDGKLEKGSRFPEPKAAS